MDAVRRLLHDIPEGGKGLVIGHTPMLERAATALTGTEVLPFRECEGVLLMEDAGEIRLEREYRLPG
ncbi:MAG TPA: hypothetical protein VEA19_08035 [Actinomycetota bacterium]|nr:hypothetical protein [Actinomycetota bacterium]